MRLSILRNHFNPVFLETGTYQGRCVDIALGLGFKKIISIEIEKSFYEFCTEKYQNRDNVFLYNADSLDVLWDIIEPIETEITFWIDAHVHCLMLQTVKDEITEAATGQFKVPILQELEIIGKHPIKTHTILIDDMRQCGKTLPVPFKEEDKDAWELIVKKDIISAVLAINSKYQIKYESHVENSGFSDIMIATVL